MYFEYVSIMIIYMFFLSVFASFLFLQSATAESLSYPKYIKKGHPMSIEAYDYYKKNSASTYYVNPDQIPAVQNNLDGSVEVIYPEGRSLTLGQKVSYKSKMEVPGKINEITCLPLNLRTRCKARFDLMMRDYRLIWKAHPDSTKIGKTVRVKTSRSEGAGETPIYRTFFATYETQFLRFAPSTLIAESEWQKLKPSHLQCDSYDWYEQLTEMFAGSSGELRLNEWSQENMNENPETELSENRTTVAHLGVNLSRTSEGIEIQNIEFPEITESFIFLFYGDVIGWNTLKGPQTCHLAFNFDFFFSASFINQSQRKIEEEPLDIVYLENERDFNIITLENQFHVAQLRSNLGPDNEFETLAFLGLIDTDFTHEEVMVEVVMIDGSIANLPLIAYRIEIKEPIE